ncbi:Zn-ribbon domain-containing OB-fold protein [Sphingosinicella sp.]|uniref:Zn-ribbon domain-containing OB-fold protein n=1 Tax=Sphingosinicella sp. TaxID=1917971 RepID=UPI0035AE22C4
MIETIPLPATDDPLDRPFWSNALEGRLVIQACAVCGEMRFPPRPMCPHCQSEDSIWNEVAPEGAVWSFACPARPLLPAFEAMAPYVTIIGALGAHPAIRIAGMAAAGDAGSVTGLTADDVRIGQPVRLLFRQVSADCALPFWHLGPPPTRKPETHQ